MRFVWKEDKNELLKKHRKISFEQIVLSIQNKRIVDIIENPNQTKYAGQIYILVELKNYIFVVPAFVSDSGEECHLKKAFPSRKYTNKFLRGKK